MNACSYMHREYRYASMNLLGPLHTELVLAGGLRVSSVTPVKSCESAVNS